MKTIQRIIYFFKREYYKLAVYENRGDDAAYGRFRVVYPDGKRTQRMCWNSAKTYAEIGDGTIVDDFNL